MDIAILTIAGLAVLFTAFQILKFALETLYDLAPMIVIWMLLAVAFIYSGGLDQESEVYDANYIESIEDQSRRGGYTGEGGDVEIPAPVTPGREGQQY